MTSQYFGGNISGGAQPGYFSLEKYHDGVLSREKVTLIRNLAQDLAKSMKLAKNVDNMNPDQLIKFIKDYVPPPGKAHVNKKGQEEICAALGDALNKRYSRTIIDVTAKPNEVCEAVSAVLFSLFSGIQSEFVGVATDVKRVLSNLTVIRNSLEANFTKLYNVIKEGDSQSAKLQAESLFSMYKDLLAEMDRQAAILAGLIDTTLDPTTKTIAELDATDEKHRGMIASLKGDVGTEDFSKKIGYLLSGVTHTALLANQVDQALKAIGASVSDYKKQTNLNDLIDKLYEIWQSKHVKPSADDVAKFISALDIIRKNDYAHQDILDYMLKGAKSLVKTGKKKHGGAVGDKSLEKRLERQSKTREVLFADLERRLETQYRTILQNIDILSKRLGQAVPLDDHLARFVRAFEELGVENGMDRENFYMALSGYRTDPTSKDERARFLGKLNAVSQSLAPMQKGPSGEYFKAVKDSIDSLVSIVDTFQDTYLKPATQLVTQSTGVMPSLAAVGGKKDDVEEPILLRPGEQPAEEDDARPQTPEPEPEADIPDSIEDAGPVEMEVLEVGKARGDAPILPVAEGGAKRGNNVVQDVKDAAAQAASGLLGNLKQVATAAVNQVADAANAKLASVTQGGDRDHGSYITLSQAAKHIRFFYRVAQIKDSLASASKDMKSYSTGYEAILGEAIGDMVMQAKKEYEDMKRRFEDEKKDEGLLLKMWIDWTTNAASAVPNDPWTGQQIAQDKEGWKAWRMSVKENALKLMKEQLDARIDFLKTVEAVEVYLLGFANAIAANPTDVKEMQHLLKSVDIVAKWFTDRSGNNISSLFESFPNEMVGPHPYFVPKDDAWAPTSGEHYYEWLGKRIKNTVDVTKNFMPANPFLGVLPAKIEGDEETNMYDAIMERAKKATVGVRVLDNIISIFAKLGSSFGNIKLQDNTFMSAGMMFKNLRKYMIHSSIVMGLREQSGNIGFKRYRNGAGNQAMIESGVVQYVALLRPAGQLVPAGAAVEPSLSHKPKDYARMGVDMTADAAGQPNAGVPVVAAAVAAPNDAAGDAERTRWVRARFCMAMSSILDSNGNSINGFRDTWADTDKLFVMVIKSMIAKIFTVIGSYGVFNKPLDKYSSVSTTRLILGGSAATPDIIPGAVELYVRLPLLAEFYRDIFAFNAGETADQSVDGKKISMVPEMDGLWENFVRVIFDETKHIKEGVYSEQHAKSLINEINIIYKKFKTPDDSNSVRNVINAFVKEVNRRYGVVKQKEIDKFIKDKQRFTSADRYPEDERLDFNILDEKGQNSRRVAPSDRYDLVVPAGERKVENQFSQRAVTLVTNFRDKMDTYIKKMAPHARETSFDDTIRQYRQQVDSAKDNDEKYRVVLKSMQGVDQLNMINQFKAAMFHEMVVAPLGTLYGVWTVLNQFSERIQGMDVMAMEKAIEAEVKGGRGTYAAFAAVLQRNNLARYLHPGFTQVAGATSWERATGAAAGAAPNPIVYRGCYGATQDLTWATIATAVVAYGVAGTPAPAKAAIMDGVKRFAIDRESLFKDFTNLVMSLGVDLGELVQIKVQTSNMNVEFGALAEQIIALLTSVKKNIELFRAIIDPNVIKRVEGGMAPDTKEVNVGSIYWLDENLNEQLIKGNREGFMSLNKLNEIISSTFRRFCQPSKVLARVNATNQFEALVEPPKNADQFAKKLYEHEKELLRDSYERPLAELAYWQPMGYARGAAVAHVHPMYSGAEQRIKPNQQRNWPFAIIPHIDDLKADDTDVKNLKALDDTLKEYILQIAQIVRALGAGVLVGVAPPPQDFGQLPGAAGVVAALANAGVAWGNSGIFFAPVAPGAPPAVPVDWRAVNAGAHDAKVPALAPGPHGAAVTEGYKRLKEVIEAYSSLWQQRDRIRSTNMRTPINARYEWYADPVEPEGAWFLNQKYPVGAPALNAGLLVRLNEVLSRYLYMGWDQSSKRIYAGLINKFANGSHANALRGKAINDVEYLLPGMDANAPILGVPSSHATVFASLARFMRNALLTQKRGKPTEFEYRSDSLMDVPLHMKENFRAMLPEFDKLFKLVIKKAETLRHVATQVSLVRQLGYLNSYGVAAGAAAPAAMSATEHVHNATGFSVLGVAGPAPNGWTTGNAVSTLPAYMARLASGSEENYAWERFAPYEPLGEEASKRWHVSLLDDIVNMASGLSKCAQDVYKELSDEPRFFETHDQAIADYVALNKRQPLMFLSQLQLAIRNRFDGDQEFDRTRNKGYADRSFMLPVYRSGETPFKFQYGSRMVLGRPDAKVSLEYMPGLQGLLDKYNGVSTGDARIDKAAFESASLSHLSLIRFLADLRHYKSVLDVGRGGLDPTEVGSSVYDAKLSGATSRNRMIEWPMQHRPFAMQRDLEAVVSFTESSDQDESLKDLLRVIQPHSKTIDSRHSARIFNIIDLNIVPINVHALTREIPLINLINYSYTCDRMIQDALLPDMKYESDLSLIKADHVVDSSRALLCKLLLHPYADLSDREYNGYFTRLLTGDTGHGLSRPKFLGDQLHNKALMGELYSMPGKTPDESGPGASNAQMRALKGIVEDIDMKYLMSLVSHNDHVSQLAHHFLNEWDGQLLTDQHARGVLASVIMWYNGLNRVTELSQTLADNPRLIGLVKSITPVVQAAIWAICNPGNNAPFANLPGVAPGNALVAPPAGQAFVLAFQPRIGVNVVVPNLVVPPPNPPGQRAVRDMMWGNVGKVWETLQHLAGTHAGDVLKEMMSFIAYAIVHEHYMAAIGEMDSANNSGALQYFRKEGAKTVIEQVSFAAHPSNSPGTAIRHDVGIIGRMRFDTKLVRNLVFLVNLQRVSRMWMREEISYLESPVVTSNAVLSRQVTEYEGNEVYDSKVFHN